MKVDTENQKATVRNRGRSAGAAVRWRQPTVCRGQDGTRRGAEAQQRPGGGAAAAGRRVPSLQEELRWLETRPVWVCAQDPTGRGVASREGVARGETAPL